MYLFSLLSVCVILCYLSVDAASIQKRHAQSPDFAAAPYERPGLLNLATRLHNIAGSIIDRAQQNRQNRPNHGFGPPPPPEPPGPPGHPGYFPPRPPFPGHYQPPPPPPPHHGGYPDWFGGHGHPGYGPPGFGPPPGGPGWPRPEYGTPPPPPPPPYGPYHGGNFPQPQPEDEDKKLISGYFDGTFPVILLDQENEVRR